jgi:hypothetical protein
MAQRNLIALALALLLATGLALAQQTPSVTIELRAVDPANASVIPPNTPVYGHLAYTTDAPVRLVLKPYRNGRPVEEESYSGSPRYAPGSGETVAWFSFRELQSIDEVRAVATSTDWGKVIAEASMRRTIEWRAGGPFAETKELVAGYWLWEVESMQEAIDWVKRCPNPMNEESDIEIRPVFAPEDFGEAFTPELKEDWKRIQAESEKLANT